jgi:predicted CXXCH cytochrome family protein
MKHRQTKRIIFRLKISLASLAAIALFSLLYSPFHVFAEEIDCLMCHEPLSKGKVVHPAIQMGCPTCHTAIDASKMPHKKTNKIAKGLSSEQPDLCFNCHDKTEFSKKNIHMPVAGGMCLSCHKPHASEHIALLHKEPVNVCLECHEDIKKKPHAVAGFSASGHPTGVQAKDTKDIADPARPGRKLYCGSCHNPHSSKSRRLFRYKADSSFQLCANCHKK